MTAATRTVRPDVRTHAELTAAVQNRFQVRTEETFPGVPGSVPAVRAWLGEFLEDLTDGKVIADILLAATEAVTNACLHSRSGDGGEFTVWVGVDTPADHATVQVVVIDEGPRVAVSCADLERVGGLGRPIIAALTSRNDECVIANGCHATWFQIDLGA